MNIKKRVQAEADKGMQKYENEDFLRALKATQQQPEQPRKTPWYRNRRFAMAICTCAVLVLVTVSLFLAQPFYQEGAAKHPEYQSVIVERAVTITEANSASKYFKIKEDDVLKVLEQYDKSTEDVLYYTIKISKEDVFGTMQIDVITNKYFKYKGVIEYEREVELSGLSFKFTTYATPMQENFYKIKSYGYMAKGYEMVYITYEGFSESPDGNFLDAVSQAVQLK